MKFCLAIVLFVSVACASARAPASKTAGRRGKLLITIGGTNSRPEQMRFFAAAAAGRGFDVVAIDYPNTVVSTICRGDADPLCFDKFREEIVLGQPVSPKVEVDERNCIECRIRALLIGQPEFLDERGEPDWGRIWVAGHSQGSGHAAYLGKLHRLGRVIMIAGPQDHFGDRVAPWVSRPGATPAERHFALLHRDENPAFGVELQLAVFTALTQGKVPQQATVTVRPASDPHNEMLNMPFAEEWSFLLREP